MFLEYAINDHGELVRIDQVSRGRLAGVYCPYCGRPLLARKGDVKAPHFAHDGETCRAASRDTDMISLPVYDRFLLHLSGRELEALREFHDPGYDSKYTEREKQRLLDKGMIVFNEFNGRSGRYEVTKLGKIPLGVLSLMLFNQVQEPLIRERHAALEEAAYKALGTPDFETALIDLRLYRAQWRRILSLTLYFIEITYEGGVLHKIGVTNRTVDERAIEIAADLHPHVGDVTIKVLGTWGRRGNVELYFKHRYAAHQQRLGDLTEYFTFDDPASVLRDLRRMKAKEIDPDEQAVIVGKPSRIEQGIPPIIPPFPLNSWLLLEQHANGIPFQLGPDNETNKEVGLAFNKLFWPGHYVEIDRSRREGYVTEKGQAYYAYFSAFFHQHYADHYEAQRRAARAEQKSASIRDGMRRAAEEGTHVGRPAEDDAAFLAKPQSKAIRAALERGLSLRETARETGASVNTIRKVKGLLASEG